MSIASDCCNSLTSNDKTVGTLSEGWAKAVFFALVGPVEI